MFDYKKVIKIISIRCKIIWKVIPRVSYIFNLNIYFTKYLTSFIITDTISNGVKRNRRLIKIISNSSIYIWYCSPKCWSWNYLNTSSINLRIRVWVIIEDTNNSRTCNTTIYNDWIILYNWAIIFIIYNYCNCSRRITSSKTIINIC